MKTALTDCNLVDILVVGRALPQEEIEQIVAFSGDEFDIQQIAVQIMSANNPRWCIRVKETGEPLVAAGMQQIGSNIWRTWFFATQSAWDDYGREITVHTAKTRKLMTEEQEYMRIETVCLATRKLAQEWYTAVGMEYESTMHGYGVNGESAVMYVSTVGARKY